MLSFIFRNREIPWKNVIDYGSDNASVMVGKNNTQCRLVEPYLQPPNVYDLGYIYHLTNTCVQYGLKKLSLRVEELLIDVYYHFFHDIQSTSCEEAAADHIEHEGSIPDLGKNGNSYKCFTCQQCYQLLWLREIICTQYNEIKSIYFVINNEENVKRIDNNE